MASYPYPGLDPSLEVHYKNSFLTKIDTMERALGAILEKLDLGKLEHYKNEKWWEIPGNEPPGCPPAGTSADPSPPVVKDETQEEEKELGELVEFEYQPLDISKKEIRLLELEFNSDESKPIRGKILHVGLGASGDDFDWMFGLTDAEYQAKITEDPLWISQQLAASQPKEYTALSYTWGAPDFDAEMILDGQRLKITSNLQKGLVQLRKTGNHTKGRWWIDQICINQSDIEERNSQVALMREVYKSATGVTVWLGEPVNPDINALDVIRGAAKHNNRQPGRPDRTYKQATKEEVRENWEELQRFFQAPWWERCWIRQEIALTSSAKICYGGKTMDWGVLEDFFSAVQYVKDIGFNPETLTEAFPKRKPFSWLKRAEDLLDLKAKNRNGSEFLELSFLIEKMRSNKATDARDKVYSVLGLADHEIYEVPVDYRLPVDEVMTTAVLSIFNAEEYPLTFGLCQNPERKQDIPSWAPNLLEDWKAQPFMCVKGTGHVYGDPSMEIDGKVLLTKGAFWETVDIICDDVLPADPTDVEVDATLEAWKYFVDQAAQNEDYRQYARDYLQNTLSTEYEYHMEGWKEFLSLETIQANRYGDPPKTAKEVDSDHDLLDLKAVRSYLVDPSFTFAPDEIEPIREFMVRYGTGRRLALTTNGYIGLFPADVEVGDEIVLVVGAPLPIVLRRAEWDDAAYEYVLVDEAWLPIVDAEGMDEAVQTIRIV